MAMSVLSNINRGVDEEDAPSHAMVECTSTPSLFIERYCSKLGMLPEMAILSKFVATKIEQNEIINNSAPHAIAASIVYFIAQVCDLNISKTDIKQVCGVSEVTINKCYKKLESMKTDLIPGCVLARYATAVA
jgi:transcription initiation factor TFIIIB Brf1 subunit/transcription initiation factor TFIIB